MLFKRFQSLRNISQIRKYTLQNWLKQSEPIFKKQECIAKHPIEGLYATIESKNKITSNIPLASQWCYFLPHTPTSQLAPDGYESDYQPPTFTLRMWAGGEIVHHIRTPAYGEMIERTTSVSKKEFKKGRSGELVFVTIQHDFKTIDKSELLMTDYQHFVYRHPGESKLTKPPNKEILNFDFKRHHLPLNEVVLFRYSALTFNAHRIHYDINYAKSEGYEGLLVHGPLTASILADLVEEFKPKNRKISKFTYRALYPCICNSKVIFAGKMEGNAMHVWSQDADNGIIYMTGKAEFQ